MAAHSNQATGGPATVQIAAAVYGPTLDGAPVVPVPPRFAALFARAHALVLGQPATAHLGDGALERFDVERAARATPEPELVDRVQAAKRPIMLAGPGVTRSGAIVGVHALVSAAQLGVANTWGAKGVFDWRSPHHLATVGLQAGDFALCAFGDADLIVTTGLDIDEAGSSWRLADSVDIPVGALGPLAASWKRPPTEIQFPRLREGLAAATQAGWAKTAAPLVPTAATRQLAAAIGESGYLAAEAGTVGFWVARTFPTSGPGTVHVPARPTPGLAIACAAIARLASPRRPVLALHDGPPDETIHDLLECAAAVGAPIAVECWYSDGDRLDADAYAARLATLTEVADPTVVSFAVAPEQLAEFVDVAGPIIAWPDLAMSRT